MDNPRHKAVHFLVIACLLLNAGMGAAMPLAEHLFGDHDHTFTVEQHNDHLHYILHHNEYPIDGVSYSLTEDDHGEAHVLHPSTDISTNVRTLKVYIPSLLTFFYSHTSVSIALPSSLEHALAFVHTNTSPPPLLLVKHTVLLI